MPAIPAHQSETIDLSTSQLSRNSQLLLTGFGCTAINGKSDGKFRSGPTFVDQLPGQIADYPDWLATVAAVERGDAFICPGDSGGAAFQLLPGIGRVLVAVNSNYDTAGKGISYLSVLGTPEGISFLNQWRCKHKQLLNGVDQYATGCRE